MLRKIMCCCGVGLGSSFLVEMNVQKTLKKFGIQDVEVVHTCLSDAYKGAADLFIVGADLESQLRDVGDTILLKNIISLPELEEKLGGYLTQKGYL